MESIMRVNMEAVTWITWSVLPRMIKKKKGAIVNIGSASTAVAPSFPLYTIYAATKSYVFHINSNSSVFSLHRFRIFIFNYYYFFNSFDTDTWPCYQDALVWSTSKAELTSRLRFSSDILFMISPCLVLVFVFFVFLSKLSFTSFLKLWSWN